MFVEWINEKDPQLLGTGTHGSAPSDGESLPCPTCPGRSLLTSPGLILTQRPEPEARKNSEPARGGVRPAGGPDITVSRGLSAAYLKLTMSALVSQTDLPLGAFQTQTDCSEE